MSRLKTVHITLTPQIADLLEAEVASGRFANISEAVRNAAWKTFSASAVSELNDAFAQLDATAPLPLNASTVVAEVQAHRREKRKTAASKG